jgi:hypothetical protein
MNYFNYAIKTLLIYFIVLYVLISALQGQAAPVWNIGQWPGEMVFLLFFIPILLTLAHIVIKRFNE